MVKAVRFSQGQGYTWKLNQNDGDSHMPFTIRSSAIQNSLGMQKSIMQHKLPDTHALSAANISRLSARNAQKQQVNTRHLM